MKFNNTVEQIENIRNSADHLLKKQLQKVADDVSNSVRVGNKILFFNELLSALTNIMYEKQNNRFVNLDEISFRILIPVPWGASGYKLWHLKQWESEILRSILFLRMDNRLVPPLYLYADEQRRWVMNIIDYPTLVDAFRYVKTYQINITEYELARQLYTDKRKKEG